MCARYRKKSRIFFILFCLTTTLSYPISGRAETDDEPELLMIDSICVQAKEEFENYALSIYHEINDTALPYQAFKCGLTGYLNLAKRNELKRRDILTICDFSKPSNEERMFIIDFQKARPDNHKIFPRCNRFAQEIRRLHILRHE